MVTKLTFLGSGSAFSYEHGQNNILLDIESGNEHHKMLVDVGSQWHDMVYKVLGKKSFEVLTDIDSIFITHLHSDHMGGLEEVAFMARFVPTIEKPKLYAPASILKEIWDKSLRGGLESLDYGQLTEKEENGLISLNSYFNPSYLADNDKIKIGEVTIEPFTTMHISNKLGQKPSCGLLITSLSGKKIMYTSDTQFCPRQLESMYKKVDMIFHDCETMPFASGVHAHYNDLKTLDADVKEKMWLMHYNDGELPDSVKDGFAGFVEQGQEFTII